MDCEAKEKEGDLGQPIPVEVRDGVVINDLDDAINSAREAVDDVIEHADKELEKSFLNMSTQTSGNVPVVGPSCKSQKASAFVKIQGSLDAFDHNSMVDHSHCKKKLKKVLTDNANSSVRIEQMYNKMKNAETQKESFEAELKLSKSEVDRLQMKNEELLRENREVGPLREDCEGWKVKYINCSQVVLEKSKKNSILQEKLTHSMDMMKDMLVTSNENSKKELILKDKLDQCKNENKTMKKHWNELVRLTADISRQCSDELPHNISQRVNKLPLDELLLIGKFKTSADDSDDEAVEEVHRLMNANLSNETCRGRGRGKGRGGRGRSKSIGIVVDERMHDDLIARKLHREDVDLPLAASAEPAAKSVMGTKMETVREQQERQKAGFKDKIAQLKKEQNAIQGDSSVSPGDISSTCPSSPLLDSHDLNDELMICEDEDISDLDQFNSLEKPLEVAHEAFTSNDENAVQSGTEKGVTKAEYEYQGSMYDSVKRRRAPDRKEAARGSHQTAVTPAQDNRRNQSTPSRSTIAVSPFGRDRSRKQNKLRMDYDEGNITMNEMLKSDVSINLTDNLKRPMEADISIPMDARTVDDVPYLPMVSPSKEVLAKAIELHSDVPQRVILSKEEERRKASQALFGDLSDSDEDDTMKEDNEKDEKVGEESTKKNEAAVVDGKRDKKEEDGYNEEVIGYKEKEKKVHGETTDDGKMDDESRKEIDKIDEGNKEKKTKTRDDSHAVIMRDLYESPCKSPHVPLIGLSNEKSVHSSNLPKNSPLQIPSTSRTSTPPLLINSMELNDILSEDHHSDTPNKNTPMEAILKAPENIDLQSLEKVYSKTPKKTNLNAPEKIDLKHVEKKVDSKLPKEVNPKTPAKFDSNNQKKTDPKSPKRVETKTPKKSSHLHSNKKEEKETELNEVVNNAADETNVMENEDEMFTPPFTLRRSSRTRKPVDHYMPDPIPPKTPKKRRSDCAGGGPISVKKNSVVRGRSAAKTRDAEELSDAESIYDKTGSNRILRSASTFKTPSRPKGLLKTPSKSARKAPAKSDLKTPAKSIHCAPIKPEPKSSVKIEPTTPAKITHKTPSKSQTVSKKSSKSVTRTSNSKSPSKKMQAAQQEQRETTPLSNSASMRGEDESVDVRPLKRTAATISKEATSDETESPDGGIDISAWKTGNIMVSRLSSLLDEACAHDGPIEMILEKTSFVWKMDDKDFVKSFCNTLMAFPQSNTWNILREVMDMDTDMDMSDRFIPLDEKNLFNILIMMQKREAERRESLFGCFFDEYLTRLAPLLDSLSVAQVTKSVRCLFLALALSNRKDKIDDARKAFFLIMQKISSQAVCQSLTYLLIEPQTVSLALEILRTTVEEWSGGIIIAMHMSGNTDCDVLDWAGMKFANNEYRKALRGAFKTRVTATMMEGLWENDMETVENAKYKAGSVTISDKGKIELDDCHKDLVVRMSLLFSHRFKVDGFDRIPLLDQVLTPAINVIDGAAKSAMDPHASLSENEARVIAIKMHIAMGIIHSFYTHGMVEGKETEDFRLHVDEWVEKTFAILHRPCCSTLVVATTSPSFEQTGLHLAIRAMKEWNEVVQPLALADLKTTSEKESPMKKRKKE